MIRLETRLRALMMASLAGDGVAYRALLEVLGDSLKPYFLKRLGPSGSHDADDLVQETLMAVHSRRATYDPSRPFTAWVHAIARYKFVDHVRSARIRATVTIDEVDALFAEDASAAALARLDVDTLLATLPEVPGDLVRKVRLEGLSMAQAASAAGMSESAVKVSIHRAVKTMAARLRGKEQG